MQGLCHNLSWRRRILPGAFHFNLTKAPRRRKEKNFVRCRTHWLRSATTTITTDPPDSLLPLHSATFSAPRWKISVGRKNFWRQNLFQNLGEILSEREAIAEAMHHRWTLGNKLIFSEFKSKPSTILHQVICQSVKVFLKCTNLQNKWKHISCHWSSWSALSLRPTLGAFMSTGLRSKMSGFLSKCRWVKETKDHHRLDGHGRTNDLPLYASFKIEMFYSVRWPLRLRRLEMQEPR